MKSRLFDNLFNYCIVSQFDYHSTIAYEEYIEKKGLTTISVENLEAFLQAHSKKMDQAEKLKAYSEKNAPNSFHAEKINFPKRVNNIRASQCKFCSKNGHELKTCREYLGKSVDDRWRWVKGELICANCYAHPYDAKNKCRKPPACTVKNCGKAHDTLLHSDKFKSNKKNKNPQKQGKRINMTRVVRTNYLNYSNEITIIPTAVAKLLNRNGDYFLARMLIDSGSEVSLIDSDTVNKLKLKTIPQKMKMLGFSERQVGESKGFVKVRILCKNNKTITITAAVVEKIAPATADSTKNFELDMPRVPGNADRLRKGPIRVLLGSDFIPLIINGASSKVFRQKTLLGTLVSGTIPLKKSVKKNSEIKISRTIPMDKYQASVSRILNNKESEPNLNFKSDMEVELKSKDEEGTLDEKFCEENFLSTTTIKNGRISTSLPLFSNKEMKTLGESRSIAIARFLAQEKRFKSKPEIYKAYVAAFKEMENSGVVEEITDNSRGLCYLTHLAVVREDKTTSKVRPVFNAALGTVINGKLTGPSLNNLMYVGKKLQNDLQKILIGCMRGKFICLADIEKLFTQIEINENQRDYLRYVFRSSENEKLKEYRWKRLVFGLTASPFIALRSLQLACADDDIARE